MYQPNLNEKCQELLGEIKTLNSQEFGNLMYHVQWVELDHQSEFESRRVRNYGQKEFYLDRGRNRAEYYARMRLSTATLDQQRAIEELNEIYKNWDKMEHDSPIYWDEQCLADDFVPEDNNEL